MQYCFCYQFHMSESRWSRDQYCFLPVPHVWEQGVQGPVLCFLPVPHVWEQGVQGPVLFLTSSSCLRAGCSCRAQSCFFPVPHVWEQVFQGTVLFLTSSICLRAGCSGPSSVSYQFHMSESSVSRAQTCFLPVPHVWEQEVQGPVHQAEQGPSQQGWTHNQKDRFYSKMTIKKLIAYLLTEDQKIINQFTFFKLLIARNMLSHTVFLFVTLSL